MYITQECIVYILKGGGSLLLTLLSLSVNYVTMITLLSSRAAMLYAKMLLQPAVNGVDILSFFSQMFFIFVRCAFTHILCNRPAHRVL